VESRRNRVSAVVGEGEGEGDEGQNFFEPILHAAERLWSSISTVRGLM
jgi:hypothetical protein